MKAGEQDTAWYFLHVLSHSVALKHDGSLYSGMLAGTCKHNPFSSSVEMISQGL